MLFLGPYDLGHALGLPPGPESPEMQTTAEGVAAAARAAGKAAAVFLGDPGLAPRYRDLGFTLIASGSAGGAAGRRLRRAAGGAAGMTRAVLLLVRVGLPAAITAAGVVLIVNGAGENEQGAGVALIGCAVMVVLFNLFLRLGWRDQRDREREEEAREHFDRTGHWPDES